MRESERPNLTPDVLIVGGGNAGLCAAIEAATHGAQVLLVEAAPRHSRGGNSRHTRNFRAMHKQPTATLTEQYSTEEYLEDLRRVTQERTNLELAQLMIEGTPDLLAFYLQHGVRFQPALSGTLSLGRTNAFFLGGGCALLNALYRSAERLGVQILYAAPLVDMVITNEAVQTATIEYQGEQLKLRPNQVIVASGGFQANLDWLQAIWGEGARNFVIRGTPFAQGVPLKLMHTQGVTSIGDADQCHAIALDARTPQFDAGIVSRVDCVCFSVVVNQQGLRFYDEGEDFWPKRYAIWGRLIAQQEHQIAYAVYDQKVANNFMPTLYPPVIAPTLEALAQALNLPTQSFVETIETFNQHVVPGNYNPQALDTCTTQGLTPAKSHWALPIQEPPFYAYPLRPGITFTYLGVQVDAAARVQAQNTAINNLYATGEIMAGNILGQGYCAGTGMAIGGVFGRIAGRTAADAANNPQAAPAGGSA